MLCLGLDIWVTKVMKPCLRAANRSNQALVILIDGVRRKVFPQFIGEHKAVVLPGRIRPEPPLHLTALLTVKQLHHEVGGRDPTPFIVFQGNQAIPPLSSPVLGLLELLVHQKRALVEVYPVPGEAQHLSLSHAGEQRDKIQQLEAVSPNLFQEHLNSIVIQRFHLLPHNPRQCTGVRRVYAKIPKQQRLGAGPHVKHRV